MEYLPNQAALSPFQFVTIATSLAAIGYIWARGTYGARKRNNRKPPGPPQDLLIGNLRQFPKSHFATTFCDWAREYGKTVYVTLPGISMLIINSHEVAQDLLSKRPNTTGGRSVGYMVKEIMGWHWVMSLKNPGTSHSNQRRMIRRGVGPQRLGDHNQLIEDRTAKLMLKLCDFTGNPHPVVLNAMGLLVQTITYGDEIVKSMEKDLISWNLEAMDMMNSAFFAFWPVDYLHILRFVPSWFPGATFKRIGKRSAWLMDQIRHQPFEMAKELHNSGKLGRSLVADLLDEFGPMDDARDSLGLLYIAGADTTTSSIIAFLHVMFLFPKIADKVYREIEAVTHGQRLPQKEAWRWHPFFPIGIPHVNSQDEVVNGTLIPKGTVILSNNEFMLTDPDVWGDPEVFRPERFLERDDLPNPMTTLFGYGMRVCPGMYLADRGGFHIAATTLALYSIVPLDDAKIPDPNGVEYTDAGFRVPIGFECRFVTRHENVRHLLKMISFDD